MGVQILTGDCRDVLRTLPDESVHCVVTSPPYWGLRDYGVAGQIGLEAEWPEFLTGMVEVFRDVRRVLRKDGTLWLNLGDCYATGAGAVGQHPGGGERGAKWAGSSIERGERCRGLRDGRHSGKHTAITARGPMTQPNRLPQPGLKPKDLVGMPWRVALALQADGWWLRSALPWVKRAGMPESATDRPGAFVEYVFLLTKAERYFYDLEAVVRPISPNTKARVAQKVATQAGSLRANGGSRPERPMRTVIRRPKRAADGSGIRGNSSFENATCHQVLPTRYFRNTDLFFDSLDRPHGLIHGPDGVPLALDVAPEGYAEAHFATFPPGLADPLIRAGCPAGGMVLDPFGGAGTTGLVAQRLGRDATLIELNPEYAAMAERRIAADRAGRVEAARIRHAHKPVDHGPLFGNSAEGCA